MLVPPGWPSSSHWVMSELIAAVNVPPYCGVPKLSHQLPVDIVVTLVVVAVVAVDVVDATADVVVVVCD